MTNIEIPFGAKDSELKGWEYTIPEGMEAIIKDGKVIVREKESEDERMRKMLIDRVHSAEELTDELREWILTYLEKHKEQKPMIQDVELNDAVYDYVRDHFIAGADFTPEYIKKLMENAFFAGVDYYLLQQESKSCESDTNVEKVIEDVIRVYGKTQGEWVGGYDVDTLIVNLRRAFNKKEQKPDIKICPHSIKSKSYSETGYPIEQKPAEWSEKDKENLGKCCAIIACPDMFFDTYFRQKCLDFLLEISKKFSLQPKQEWSEEDENNLNKLLQWDGIPLGLRSWISGLPEKVGTRPSWKPSEEQMEAFKGYIEDFQARAEAAVGRWNNFDVMIRLYEQLKKL